MLNLYKLEIFMKVAAEGSLSAAAERLLMTQPGVSQHVRELERTLGAQLFVRSPRGVALTEAGRTLYDYAQRIATLVAEAEAAVTDVAQLEEGHVSLGATPGVSVYVLAEWVQDFRHRYPNLTVQTQTEITPHIVASLLAQRLDIGVIEGELSESLLAKLGVHELETLDHFVVVGPKHPLWLCKTVKLAELGKQNMIVRQRGSQTRIWLEEVLAQQGITPVIDAEFDNVESIKRVVMAGTALTILPDYAVRDEVALERLHALPVADYPLQRTLKLIWDRQRYFSPVTRFLLRHLSERFPALRELNL